jgi:hypothetical protein
MARRLFEPSIPRRELNALRLLSLLDLALLAALVYAVLTGLDRAVDYLGLAYGVVFLVVLGGVVVAARRAWWSWRLAAAVALLGPLASVPTLEHYARATRMSLRPGSAMRGGGVSTRRR